MTEGTRDIARMGEALDAESERERAGEGAYGVSPLAMKLILPEGEVCLIFANGMIEGFPAGTLIVNRIPHLLANAEIAGTH